MQWFSVQVFSVEYSVAVIMVATIYGSMCHIMSITLLWPERQGHKGWQMNHILATALPLPCLTFAIPFLPMEQQGTANLKFSQDSSPNLGSLRPIIAQRTARYDVVNKCVGSMVNPFIKH